MAGAPSFIFQFHHHHRIDWIAAIDSLRRKTRGVSGTKEFRSPKITVNIRCIPLSPQVRNRSVSIAPFPRNRNTVGKQLTIIIVKWKLIWISDPNTWDTNDRPTNTPNEIWIILFVSLHSSLLSLNEIRWNIRPPTPRIESNTIYGRINNKWICVNLKRIPIEQSWQSNCCLEWNSFVFLFSVPPTRTGFVYISDGWRNRIEHFHHFSF